VPDPDALLARHAWGDLSASPQGASLPCLPSSLVLSACVSGRGLQTYLSLARARCSAPRATRSCRRARRPRASTSSRPDRLRSRATSRHSRCALVCLARVRRASTLPRAPPETRPSVEFTYMYTHKMYTHMYARMPKPSPPLCRSWAPAASSARTVSSTGRATRGGPPRALLPRHRPCAW